MVVNAASNIDGRLLTNLSDLVRDTHARGGIVIVDAAQAMGHSRALLQKTDADALCFSAHKMYGASLGVVVAYDAATKQLLTVEGGVPTTDDQLRSQVRRVTRGIGDATVVGFVNAVDAKRIDAKPAPPIISAISSWR